MSAKEVLGVYKMSHILRTLTEARGRMQACLVVCNEKLNPGPQIEEALEHALDAVTLLRKAQWILREDPRLNW